MTDLKLLPCLCGGEPLIFNPTDTGYPEDYIGDYYAVCCDACALSIGDTFQQCGFKTEAEAVKAWNERVKNGKTNN